MGIVVVSTVVVVVGNVVGSYGSVVITSTKSSGNSFAFLLFWLFESALGSGMGNGSSLSM